jgi:hypothetical protein
VPTKDLPVGLVHHLDVTVGIKEALLHQEVVQDGTVPVVGLVRVVLPFQVVGTFQDAVVGGALLLGILQAVVDLPSYVQVASFLCVN